MNENVSILAVFKGEEDQMLFEIIEPSVSGQFLDYAQSQRHSVRSTRRKANFCPFWYFLLIIFHFFYAGDSLRCPRCFLPPVTASSKKSPRKRHTDTPASFTVLTTLK